MMTTTHIPKNSPSFAPPISLMNAILATAGSYRGFPASTHNIISAVRPPNQTVVARMGRRMYGAWPMERVSVWLGRAGEPGNGEGNENGRKRTKKVGRSFSSWRGCCSLSMFDQLDKAFSWFSICLSRCRKAFSHRNSYAQNITNKQTRTPISWSLLLFPVSHPCNTDMGQSLDNP